MLLLDQVSFFWRNTNTCLFWEVDNTIFRLKENALHYAARSGRSDVVSLLISRGVDSKQKGECGYPIDVTECASIREMLERYMDFPVQPVPAPQSTENDTNSEILVSPVIPRRLSFDSDVSQASSNSTTETSTLLLPEENSLEKEPRAEDTRRSSEQEKYLLLSTPTPDAIYKHALHRACQKGELEVVKELIKLRVRTVINSEKTCLFNNAVEKEREAHDKHPKRTTTTLTTTLHVTTLKM